MQRKQFLKFYRDGFEFLWWGFRVRKNWIRGLCLGFQHEVGPWKESRWTHSTLILSFIFIQIRVEHTHTRVKLKSGDQDASLPNRN